MRYDKITIVINTFNSEDKIHQCINSIESKAKVIIIENSNNIKFKEELEKKYSNLKCFLAGENLGYAKGNNLGLSKVKSKYALILNPDATLSSDTLEEFLNSAENFPNFAIIGPAKQDEYSISQDKENPEQVFQVNSLKGFAMFLNLEEFKEVGFFDENFFIYLEEIDLCKRLKKKGKKIYLDRKVIVNHIGGSSHNKKIDFEMELSRNWHWMWSTFYFNKKHFGYLYAVISVSKNFFSSLIKILFFSLIFNQLKKKNIFTSVFRII